MTDDRRASYYRNARAAMTRIYDDLCWSVIQRHTRGTNVTKAERIKRNQRKWKRGETYAAKQCAHGGRAQIEDNIPYALSKAWVAGYEVAGADRYRAEAPKKPRRRKRTPVEDFLRLCARAERAARNRVPGAVDLSDLEREFIRIGKHAWLAGHAAGERDARRAQR